jgi:hypothetical protein
MVDVVIRSSSLLFLETGFTSITQKGKERERDQEIDRYKKTIADV